MNKENIDKQAIKAKAEFDKYGKLYDIKETNLTPVSGTKYSHLGHRSGIASHMDKALIEHNLQQRAKNYGGGGYTFQMIDSVGKADPHATLNIGGRVFQPRADGTFHVVDKDFLDLIAREAQERKDYIRQIVNHACISDEICAHVLGVEAGQLKTILDSGSPFCKSIGITDDLNAYQALPSYLDCLSEDSTFFTGGLAKLTKVISAFMPVLESCTPAAVEHAGEE